MSIHSSTECILYNIKVHSRVAAFVPLQNPAMKESARPLSRSHGESKHHKIIRAALKVFAQKGFYNARVSEIAKEAQVADGTIYLYFKNKDDILIHLFEEEMDGIIQNVKAVVDPLDKSPRQNPGLREKNTSKWSKRTG